MSFPGPIESKFETSVWKAKLTVLGVLENEIVTAMRLMGVTSVADLHPGMVECLQEMWK